VGAVILATGSEVFDPTRLDTYSYSNLPNVITSMEFERILSASGPYRGHLMRPYDREEPKKIAWLQCVGSRDLHHCDNSYCSGVCCMYAIKEAVIAKEHSHSGLDATIFFMDIRTYGKDFEHYYNRAKDEHGVRFIRSRIHSVEPTGDGDLEISWADEEGRISSEVFNLVVLSVGLQVGQETVDLAKRLGVDLNENRFAKTECFSPVSTSRPGVYVCGALQGPKDIPQSVMEASAAASASSLLLSDVRWTQAIVKEKAPETNVRGEPPRVGVFVCQCGINIGGVVNVPEVREYARNLPYVTYVEDNLYTCSQDTQVKMAQVIKEKGLNRVVVAACTPRSHEPLFQETMTDAGLNKYLFEMANIRNQDSWVHASNPEQATIKAKDLIRMAVAKVALLEPLDEPELSVNRKALVIGGGVAGMVAAKTIADQGYPVYLIEKSDKLGGQALNLYRTWHNDAIQPFVKELAESVQNHANITVHLSTDLKTVEGFVGNFKTTVQNGAEPQVIEHGVAIIATGGKEFKPAEYGYGSDPRIITHMELDRLFMNNDPKLKDANSAVFIQCVGSRQPDRPYCSRVCCTHSLESALQLKKLNPDMDIYVLYRDLRSYGEREELYLEARKAGVIFIRFAFEDKPKVEAVDGKLRVTVTDHVLRRPITLTPDFLTLSTAIQPNETAQLGQFFKVPVSEDGFFIEAHAKLRPVDFATDGVFMCGLAHYPKSIDESIAQAQAAASRASIVLALDTIHFAGTVAYTNQPDCSACATCISICPFSAPGWNERSGKAEINAALCKGCGLCVASCRSGAIKLRGFDDAQIFSMIDSV
jgi:heterodisulfide reductase subunit A2